MHVGGLLPAYLCLVTLLCSEELFAVLKSPPATRSNGKQNIKTKCIGNNAKASRVNRNTL